MGKYLDKTGLQYFYNKLKDKFADKSTIETKLDSITGAFTWKGELSALPTDLSSYSAGNVIKVGTKEYVCTETNGTKAWDELGDEGSYLLKTAAESTYLKKAAGEVKTDNLADGSVTSEKINKLILTKDTTTISLTWFEELRTSSIKNECVYYYINGTYIPLIAHNNTKISPTGEDTFDGVDLFFSGVETSSSVCNARLLFAEVCFYKDKSNSIELDTNIYDSQFLIDTINAVDFGEEPYFKGENIIDESIVIDKLSTDVQTSLGKADTALQSVPRATLTSDGTVRANPLSVALKDLANSSTSYGGVKVAMGSDGVLGVGWGSKDYFGVVKIGDGLNVSNGLVSIADKSITKAKLDTSVQTSLGKADNAVQLGTTNEVSGTNATTLKINNSGGGRLDVVGSAGTTSMSGNNIAVGLPSSEISTVIYKGGIGFSMRGTNYGSIKVNSNNKLQITGLDTPTSDTDAANKKYVDGLVSDIVGPLGLYEGDDDTSIAANKTAISDYETKLKSLGIDITKHAYIASWYCVNNSDYSGICYCSSYDYNLYGFVSFMGYLCKMECTHNGKLSLSIYDDNGSYNHIANISDINEAITTKLIDELSNYQKTSSDDLKTTDISIVGAINEVNTLAKSKASTAVATKSANGLMSAADKKKLDGVDAFEELKTKTLEIPVTGKESHTVAFQSTGVDGELEFSSDVDTVLLKNISDPVDDSDAATKAYVDSKITGGANNKIVLLYDDDNNGGTTTSITGEQYKLITDAISANRTPDIELVMYTGGEYFRYSLGYFFDNELYFMCTYPGDDIGGTYMAGVKTTISYTASSDGTYSVDYENYGENTLDSFLREYMKSYADTEVVTGGSKSLSVYGTRNFIWTMGTNFGEGFATFTLPSSAYDGLTYTFTKICGTAVTGYLNITSSSTNIKDVKNSTAVKTMSVTGTTLMKLTAVYSSTGKCWYVYKQSIE